MGLNLSGFPIIKASATGNDFLLVDLLSADNAQAWSQQAGSKPREQWAKELCDRHHGLGADGLVFLEPFAGLDFGWDFYNSDGSRAEMCGNATRAVGLYYHSTTGKKEARFQTRTGPVLVTVNSQDDIRTDLAPIQSEEWAQRGTDSSLSFDFVSTGNPHAVVSVPGLKDKTLLRALAQKVKSEKRFFKDGVNVTFVHPVSPTVIESQTFERGVEDFTLSCGTGAVAAAHSILRGKPGQSMEVRVPGGTLFVIWNNGRPTLSGPARIVAQMRLVQGV